MQFLNPNAFLLLWLIPALAAVFIFSQKVWQQRVAKIGHPPTLQSKLMPAYLPSEWKIRLFYLMLVFIFSITALAEPQWGAEKKKIERKGIDIIFLLDTSLSMLAEDAKPSRLEKSKMEIKSFVRRLKGDRAGMVAFAGSGFLQSPLTLDYSAFLLFLDAIKTGYIPDPGTSLARAVSIAIRSFPEKDLKHKAMIVFTDGEDHEGGMDAALEEVKKANIRIYTMGVGKPEGEPIPLKDQEGKKTGFKKDKAGQIVITKLNQPLLEHIAAETGGLYLPSTPGEQEIELIIRHMESLGKKQFKEKLITEKEDHYQLFLFWALFFLAAEMLQRRAKKIPAQTAAMLFACFFLFSGFLEGTKTLNDNGNKLYQEKKYQSALDQYRKAKVKSPEDPAVRYNLATTMYQINSYQEAAKELETAISQAKDPALHAKALYNYGNTQYRLGNFEKAIDSYQKSLELNPKDEDAKFNLEFLQKEKSAFQKKDQERKKDQQKQDQKNQQQNQQQQSQQNQQQKNQKQDQQQNNQNQQPNQNQQKQDQQKDQQQNQQDQQQKEDQKQEGQQDQQDQQKKDEQEKEDQQKEEEKKQDEQKNQEEQKQDQEQKDQQNQQPQPGEENPQPADQEKGEEDQPAPGSEREQQSMKPLQGQMTMANALNILDALKEGEKDLQDLRRPQPPKEQTQVEKDW